MKLEEKSIPELISIEEYIKDVMLTKNILYELCADLEKINELINKKAQEMYEHYKEEGLI